MPEAFEPTDDRPKSARDGRHRAVTTAVLGLAVGKPVALVAKEASVSVRTLHQWSAKPEFRARVTKVRGQLLDRALARVQAVLVARVPEGRARRVVVVRPALRAGRAPREAGAGEPRPRQGKLDATRLRARPGERDEQAVPVDLLVRGDPQLGRSGGQAGKRHRHLPGHPGGISELLQDDLP